MMITFFGKSEFPRCSLWEKGHGAESVISVVTFFLISLDGSVINRLGILKPML